MSEGCDGTFPRLIDAIGRRAIAPRRWVLLHEHVKGCAPCRARYDRAVLAERMLHGGPGAALRQSPAEIAAIEEAVLAAAAGERARGRGLGALLAWGTARWRMATAAVTVALACLLVPSVLHRHRPPPSDELQARGGAEGLRPVGIRAFCVTPDAVAALDPPADRAPGMAAHAPRCARAAALQLAATNRGGLPSLFLVGLDGDRQLKWYAPRPPEAGSVPAPPPGSVDATVGTAVRLAVNHRAGPLRIYGLFSDRPVSVEEVERAAAELARRGQTAESAAELPLGRGDVQQVSLLVEIDP